MSRLAAAVVLCCVPLGRVAVAKTAISESSVRRAISTFLSQPTSPVSKQAKNMIIEFAVDSDDVSVVITSKATPWSGRKDCKHAGVLLCAFIAGNILSQLDSGVKADDSYSGLMKVFRVYRHLKSAEKSYNVPEVEQLLAMHRQGRLMRHLLPEEDEDTGGGR